MNIVRLFTFVFLVSLLFNGVSFAQINFTTDEGQFLADNQELAFQDFQAADAPANGIIFCNVPVNENSNGNCFSPGDILPGIEFTDVPPNNDGLGVLGENFSNINNNPPNLLELTSTNENFDTIFSHNTRAVGMILGCVTAQAQDNGCNRSIVVEVFGDGGVLGSTTVPVTDLTNSFIGITSQERISRISLHFENPGGIQFITMLNIRFDIIRNIPTLSEWGLIAMAGILGLVGFIAIRKRYTTA